MQIIATYRLIADSGKILTNGTQEGYVVDLAPSQSVNDWKEIDDIPANERGDKI